MQKAGAWNPGEWIKTVAVWWHFQVSHLKWASFCWGQGLRSNCTCSCFRAWWSAMAAAALRNGCWTQAVKQCLRSNSVLKINWFRQSGYYQHNNDFPTGKSCNTLSRERHIKERLVMLSWDARRTSLNSQQQPQHGSLSISVQKILILPCKIMQFALNHFN